MQVQRRISKNNLVLTIDKGNGEGNKRVSLTHDIFPDWRSWTGLHRAPRRSRVINRFNCLLVILVWIVMIFKHELILDSLKIYTNKKKHYLFQSDPTKNTLSNCTITNCFLTLLLLLIIWQPAGSAVYANFKYLKPSSLRPVHFKSAPVYM